MTLNNDGAKLLVGKGNKETGSDQVLPVFSSILHLPSMTLRRIINISSFLFQ